MRPFGLHHGAHGYRIQIVDDPRRKKKKSGGDGKMTSRPPSRRGRQAGQQFQYSMEEKYDPTKMDMLRAERARDPTARPIPLHVQNLEQLRTYEMVQDNIERARLTGQVQGLPRCYLRGSNLCCATRALDGATLEQ